MPPGSPPTAGPGPAGAVAPRCPRHPDTVTYVNCQRCGLPTCPECQRPAPVGVQCVGCVKKASDSQRRERTIYGGRATSGRPIVTITLMLICLALWLGELASDTVFSELAFASFLGDTQPWRFITGAFLHDPNGPYHIALNMYTLWLVGGYLEPMLGRARYLVSYLLCALGGNVAWLWFSTPAAGEAGSWYTAVVGASGAIFGLFGLLVLVNRDQQRDLRSIYIIVGINFAIGFILPGIAWQAHLGGFLVGLVCGAVLTMLRAKQASLQWVMYFLIAVVLVVAAVVRYAIL